jgi:class III poly(R)-hydroxyalkanoic acid synthase PhaE subunit
MTDTPTSLYSAWLDVLPQAFRAMVPGAAAAAAPASDGAGFAAHAMPFPAEQIGNALNTLDGILTQLYQGYLPLLAKGELTAEPLKQLAGAASDAFNRLLAGMAVPSSALAALPGWGNLAQAMQPWAGLMQGLLPGAQTAAAGGDQLRLGIERTFGGLGDAFGLGPMRELEQAWREMLVASAAKRRAQVEYLALVAQAWNKGTLGLIQELQAMGARGERVESLLAFIRLWAKSVDAPLHETMQEARGLEVTAKVIRASSQHREQLQKTIGLASEALHMPTRKDMDDAFREIQELKRELRRLKRVLPAAAQNKLIHSKESDA